MPRYDYRCPSCSAVFEISRGFRDADRPANCPMCDVEATRQISIPTLAQFVGSRGRSSRDAGQREAAAPRPNWYRHGHSHGPGTGSHRH